MKLFLVFINTWVEDVGPGSGTHFGRVLDVAGYTLNLVDFLKYISRLL